LVRQIEHPRVPSDWMGVDGFGGRGFGGMRVATSVMNGNRVVSVEDPTGRRSVTIREGMNGIDMTVTGVEDGEPVTVRFHARSAADLRAQDADAYRVYQRWAGTGARPFVRGVPLVPPRQQPFRLAVPAEPILRPPADDLFNLEARVGRQLQQAKVDPQQRREVTNLLQQLQQIQTEGQAQAAGDLDKQIRRYNALSDALRDKLRELKLPDPGDALPPPASSRLGVSVGAGGGADDGLTVSRVVPDSRGARIGLKDGDVIHAVNGKAVADTTALRRAVTDAKEPLVLEVVRDGQPITLREKPAK
jgi:hypothetical protein